MSQFQTAGVLYILVQMLRYFTDTQIDIQTAHTKKIQTAEPNRRVFFVIPNMAPNPIFYEFLTQKYSTHIPLVLHTSRQVSRHLPQAFSDR